MEHYLHAIQEVKKVRGTFLVEGGVLEGPGYESGCYVKPCIAEAENHWDIVQHETFAPILYLLKYSNLEEAIACKTVCHKDFFRDHDQRPHGSRTIPFYKRSDCGIANVNIGTSGAEIGGAFRRVKKKRAAVANRLRCLESVYAPSNQHDQLQPYRALGAGD